MTWLSRIIERRRRREAVRRASDNTLQAAFDAAGPAVVSRCHCIVPPHAGGDSGCSLPPPPQPARAVAEQRVPSWWRY